MDCPICNKKELIPISLVNVGSRTHKIVCENENYLHLTRNGQHFLCKTSINVLEEIEAAPAPRLVLQLN